VSDLSAALRADGHDELAAALERKELAGRLRQSGRDDLADALISGRTPPAEEVEAANEPTTPPAAHEQLAEQLNAAQSKWLTLGGPGGSDDGQAA
jgi:hypothetical protein